MCSLTIMAMALLVWSPFRVAVQIVFTPSLWCAAAGIQIALPFFVFLSSACWWCGCVYQLGATVPALFVAVLRLKKFIEEMVVVYVASRQRQIRRW